MISYTDVHLIIFISDEEILSRYGDNILTRYNKVKNETEPRVYTKVTTSSKELTDFAKAKNIALQDGLPVSGSVYGRRDSDGTWHFYLANVEETNYDQHITQAMINSDDNLKIYLNANGYLNADGTIKAEYMDGSNSKIYGKSETTEDKTVWNFVTEESGSADQAIRYYGNSLDEKDYSMAYSVPSYIGNSRLTELSELIVNDDIDQVADLAQILQDCPDSSVNKYLSFNSATGNLEYEGSGIYTFELNGKNYYTTEADLQNSAGYPYDKMKPIDAQAKLAYYNASYINKKIELCQDKRDFTDISQ